MMTIGLIDGLLFRALECGASGLLRFLGGPDHLPRSNEDFVWF